MDDVRERGWLGLDVELMAAERAEVLGVESCGGAVVSAK